MIIAYRRWNVGPGRLVPVTDPWPSWKPGINTARCTGTWGEPRPFQEHGPVPDGDCRCGFYARRRPIALCTCGDPLTPRHGVVGVVKLGGRIVEHEDGYRAEKAQVVAYVDHTGDVTVDYGCPVYPDVETMWAEWAPDADAWDLVVPGGNRCPWPSSIVGQIARAFGIPPEVIGLDRPGEGTRPAPHRPRYSDARPRYESPYGPRRRRRGR